MDETRKTLDELVTLVAGDYGCEDRPMSPREWNVLFDAGKLPNREVFVRTSTGHLWRYPAPFEIAKRKSEEASRRRINPERRFVFGTLDQASGAFVVGARNLRRGEAMALVRLAQGQAFGSDGSMVPVVLESDLTGCFLSTLDGSRTWRRDDILPNLPG